MRGRYRKALPSLMVVVLLAIAACGATPQPKVRGAHEWDDEDSSRAEITDDLDEAEARWRSELEATRWEDGARVFDDPAASLRKSASLTVEESATAEKETDEAPPAGTWNRFKAGADTVGRVGFAAMTVLVTVGIAVAPYLLL